MLPELSSTRMMSTGSLVIMGVALVEAQVGPFGLSPGEPPLLVSMTPVRPALGFWFVSMAVTEPPLPVPAPAPWFVEPVPGCAALHPAAKTTLPMPTTRSR